VESDGAADAVLNICSTIKNKKIPKKYLKKRFQCRSRQKGRFHYRTGTDSNAEVVRRGDSTIGQDTGTDSTWTEW
jgi:hypothetical protein